MKVWERLWLNVICHHLKILVSSSWPPNQLNIVSGPWMFMFSSCVHRLAAPLAAVLCRQLRVGTEGRRRKAKNMLLSSRESAVFGIESTNDK